MFLTFVYKSFVDNFCLYAHQSCWPIGFLISYVSLQFWFQGDDGLVESVGSFFLFFPVGLFWGIPVCILTISPLFDQVPYQCGSLSTAISFTMVFFFFPVISVKVPLNCLLPQAIPGIYYVFPVPHLESTIASWFFLLGNRDRKHWMCHDPLFFWQSCIPIG